MTAAPLPRVPIDREQIVRIRERLRQQIRDAPPLADPVTRELQENVARGAGGRDLLKDAAYRDHFETHAAELIEHVQHLREDLDQQAGDHDELPS
jgi:hypothetical protein